MAKTKIEWADDTWNPVTGCLNNCRYCYAKRQVKRFEGDTRLNLANYDSNIKPYEITETYKDSKGKVLPYPFGFEPTLHRYRLDKPTREPGERKVFVGSMTDLFGDWIPLKWIVDVLDACLKFPQHKYLFLTKNPKRYMELDTLALLPHESNFWYGVTIDGSQQLEEIIAPVGVNVFLSLEPIQNEIDLSKIRGMEKVKWVIVGAETGINKNKAVPQKEWIDKIAFYCLDNQIPLFMKDNLSFLYEGKIAQVFPKKLEKDKNALTAAQKRIRYGTCGICKTKSKKSEMVTILFKETRKESAKIYTHLCYECFKNLGGLLRDEDPLEVKVRECAN